MAKQAALKATPVYEKRLSQDGVPVYYRDQKRIKKIQVPKGELIKLEPPVIVDEPIASSATVESEALIGCIMCGKEATKQRAVDMQTVVLCDDDYFNTTLGKIAHKIRSEHEQVLSA